ncbi:MAG: hypothetical protein AAF772_04080 [Acidobacteriota bacterium]
MQAGEIVLLHLINPSEKYWGAMLMIAPHGVTLRGINLASFDDWLADLSSDDEPDLGTTTVFFPMHRIECIFLDAPAWAVPSCQQRLERRTGRAVTDVLDLHGEDDALLGGALADGGKLTN